MVISPKFLHMDVSDKELHGVRAPFCILVKVFLKGAYNIENTFDRNSNVSCSLSETSIELIKLITGYLNVGCFRLALRNW